MRTTCLAPRVFRAALATACFLALAAPSGVQATPESLSEQIESKKTQRKAAIEELSRMQAELDAEVDEYVELGEQMDRARGRVAEVNEQIDVLDAKLIAKEDALVERVIELYRSDRVGLLGILLDARSASDLLNRLDYLVAISQRDSRLITDVRLARSESTWLQEGLTDQVRMLSDLQYAAAQQRSQIESGMAAQQAKAAELGKDIRRLVAQERLRLMAVGGIPSGEFNPDAVMSDAQFSNVSMTAEDVQAFLDKQPGILKSYVGPDHAGSLKTAAQMIYEAGVAWSVNPKVILVTLQKEQSLLERTHPTQRAFDWAMGYGKMDSRTLEGYAGFGNQVWHGARGLRKNGGGWRPGIEMKIDGSLTMPMNSSTYTLYKYTPHFHGVMSFWRLYWRYFGDPLATPTPPA